MAIKPKGRQAESTIYVRVAPEYKDILQDLAAREDVSERQIIEQLLKRFGSLSQPEQKEILNLDAPSTPLGNVGATIAYLAWADHAFTLRHWEWALDAYLRLERESRNVPEFQQFALYREGFCWLDVALGLRREIIDLLNRERAQATEIGVEEMKSGASRKSEDDWNQYYQGADDATCMALLKFQKFLDLGRGDHPAVRFNLACCWGLRAQFAVEKALGWKSRLIPELAEGFSAGEKPIQDKFWERFCANWRDVVSRVSEQTKELINEKILTFANRAMDELDVMVKESKALAPADGPGLVVPLDTGFLVRMAMGDSDLEFLRRDPQASLKFNAWFAKHNVEQLKLKSFQRYWDQLADEVREIRNTF